MYKPGMCTSTLTTHGPLAGKKSQWAKLAGCLEHFIVCAPSMDLSRDLNISSLMIKHQERRSGCRRGSLKPGLARNIVENSVCLMAQLEMSPPPCRNCACRRDGHCQRSEWDVACIIVKQTRIFHRQFAGRLTRGLKLWVLIYECNFGLQYFLRLVKTRTRNSNHTDITNGILTACDLLPDLTHELSFLCYSSACSNRRYRLDVSWITRNIIITQSMKSKIIWNNRD